MKARGVAGLIVIAVCLQIFALADDAGRKNGPEQLLKKHPELINRYRALLIGKAFADEWRDTANRDVSTSEYKYEFNLGARTQMITDGSSPSHPDVNAFPAKPKVKQGIDTNPVYAANSQLLIDQSVMGYRIVGGGECGPGEFRECVAVIGQQTTQCTGTLVAPNLVLTAAHCAEHGGPRKIFVGEHVGESTGKYYPVKKPYLYPANRQDGTRADLMLLELENSVEGVDPIPIAKDQVPADFPSESNPVDFRLLRIVGFGRNQPDGGGTTGIKRFADVPTAGGYESEYHYRTDDEFVAGLEGSYRDTCNGDSGGPAYAYVAGEDVWYLIGCTSRATTTQNVQCGDGGVYTRVDKYRDWIRQVATSIGATLP